MRKTLMTYIVVLCLVLLGVLAPRPCLAGGAPALILVQPLDSTVLNQGTAVFTVVASSLTTMTFQWFKDGVSISGATGSTYTISNCDYTDQGVYVVKVTNGGGTVSSSGATLTVFGAPAITTQPVNQSITQAQNASFSVLATGTGPLKYQWNFNGTALVGATSSALNLVSMQATNIGNYSVIVTNAYGVATSSVATLTVILFPTITTQPQTQVVAQHSDVTFSVVAGGTAPFNYKWYFKGSPLGDATNSPTYKLHNVSNGDEGNYRVVITNSVGSITSSVASLTVMSTVGITTPPQTQIATSGSNVTLRVSASGDGPLSYQWSFNNLALAGATQSSLTFNPVSTNNSGIYGVTITNAVSSATSATATLTVFVPPSITAQPENRTSKAGSNTTFSATVTGTAPLSYQWNLNGTALAGATNSALNLTSIQPMNEGNYTLVATNAGGSVTSAVATLTVLIPPAILTQPTNRTLIVGNIATISVTATGTGPLKYQWLFNGTALAGATNSALTLTGIQSANAGNYSVAVTNLAGSIISTTATLAVTMPDITLSLPASGGISPNGFSFQFSAPAGCSYVISASSDLQNWVPIATNTTLTGNVVFTDEVASNYPTRLYRVGLQ